MSTKLKDSMTPLDYAVCACDTIMNMYAPEQLPPTEYFHYHQGVSLSGMLKTYELTNDEKYLRYIKAWVDTHIDENGNVLGSRFDELDDIQPGVLLYVLYEKTQDERYRRAIDLLASKVVDFRRNPEGGFWHKGKWANQMWLDGLYMGGPILAMYGKYFNRPLCFEICAFQALLMEKKTLDKKTGLMYHGYDQSRKADWADPITGCSSEFWGRAMGWVPLALEEELDYIPREFALRDEMIRMVCDLLKSLVPYQDENSGLWYQVVNKGEDPRNWLETSCTCLYTGGIAKAVRLGWLDRSYLKFARKGYEGVIKRLGFNDAGLLLDNICVGTNVGDLDFYLKRPVSCNDLHGMGAFILMCVEMARLMS